MAKLIIEARVNEYMMRDQDKEHTIAHFLVTKA